MRSDDEKMALTLHRYKNWVETILVKDREIVGLQAQIAACTQQLLYAYLEAREEQEHLIDMGLSRQEIEGAGTIPIVPMDPLALLKQIRKQAK